MTPAGPLNALRLVDADTRAASPAGVILSRREAAAMAGRFAKRAPHYPTLRVTGFQDRLIFWSPAEDVQLPWFEGGAVYLTHIDKTLFFPIDKRLNLPVRWSEPIIARLASAESLSRPVLLWHWEGRLTAIGLGLNSCRFAAVDWKGIGKP